MAITLDGNNLLTTGLLNSFAVQNSTSGTAIDFVGIPTTAKRVTVVFNGISLSSTAQLLIQLGSGSISTSSYGSSTQYLYGGVGSGYTTSTAGFILWAGTSARFNTGTYTFYLMGSNTWVGTGITTWDTELNYCCYHAGKSPSLGNPLDRVRITSTSTDTFDAGTVNVFYE